MGNNLRRLRTEVSDRLGSLRKSRRNTNSNANAAGTDGDAAEQNPATSAVAGAEGGAGVSVDAQEVNSGATTAATVDNSNTPEIQINDVVLSEVDQVSVALPARVFPQF